MSSVDSFIKGNNKAQTINCLLEIASIKQAKNNQSPSTEVCRGTLKSEGGIYEEEIKNGVYNGQGPMK